MQKILADAGIASRRASEAILLAGRVSVNGQVVRELGAKADPEHDRVSVDGKVLKSRRKIHLALNKPRGCVCSRSDPQERFSIHDLLPREWDHLYSVGRLDRDSDGLIFLTNDGDFCLRLTHPRYGVRKIYHVTVEKRITGEALERMRQGIEDHGEHLKAHKARLLESTPSASLVELELTEGKNREARRLLESQGFVVTRLQRIQIGPIKLGELPLGKWRTLTEPEIKSLLSAV